MAAGSKVSDTKQEYQYATLCDPSGHEFTFYDTPENETWYVSTPVVLTSSPMLDGSVFTATVKDVHTQQCTSAQAETTKGADATTNRIDTDYTMDVGGRLVSSVPN